MGAVSWSGRGAWATSVASHACCGVMRPGRPWWGALGVVHEVEAVYLLLKFGDGGGQGLLVQVAEQGLVEALVLALGGGVVGLGGDGLDPQRAHVLHQASGTASSAGVKSDAVVGQQTLGHTPGGYAFVEDVDGGLAGLARGDQGGHRQAGVVVLELEDDHLASLGDDVLGGACAASRRWGRGKRTVSRSPVVSWTARSEPPPGRGRAGPATPVRVPSAPWRPSCRAR